MADKLTSLWKRMKLDKLLISHAAAYHRHAETYCVMVLDVDHLKSINDTYGYNTGDAVLVELANILKQTMRGNDIVGRWGGEEFMVLVSKSEAIKAQVVAEKIRMSVRQHEFLEVGNVTISIGICEVSEQLSILKMIDRADQALYKAKDSGRDRVCLFVPAKLDKEKVPSQKRVSQEVAH